METEEQIVYSIIETVKKGTLSDDSRLDERIIRNFLKIYRASAISKYSMEGMVISDECFQYMGLLEFDILKSKQFVRDMPKVIRLKSNFGIFFEKNGENIPILNSEEYALGLKSIINKRLPKAKFLSSKATIYIGYKEMYDCGGTTSPLNTVIDDFIEDLSESGGQSITVDVHAVLDNPENAPDYDWTVSPYPCNSELIDEIKSRIMAKEFNLILQIKTDKVTNGNDQETGQVRENQQD